MVALLGRFNVDSKCLAIFLDFKVVYEPDRRKPLNKFIEKKTKNRIK